MPSTQQRHVLSYPTVFGPKARFFDSLRDLVSYSAGWCEDGQLEILVVNEYDFRSCL
jgi:hypothetical protein